MRCGKFWHGWGGEATAADTQQPAATAAAAELAAATRAQTRLNCNPHAEYYVGFQH